MMSDKTSDFPEPQSKDLGGLIFGYRLRRRGSFLHGSLPPVA